MDTEYARSFWGMIPNGVRLGIEVAIWIAVIVLVSIWWNNMIRKSTIKALEKRERERQETAPNYLNGIVNRLIHLEEDLRVGCHKSKNILDCLVYFLQKTTQFCDVDLDVELLELVVPKKDLDKLKRFRCFVGRNPQGVNRTKPGATVSKTNVYLGGMCGIPQLSIADFTSKDCKNADDAHELKMICDQAGEFIRVHSEMLKNLIDALDTHSKKIIQFVPAA